MIPIVSIVGHSDAGKTTLIEKLIAELTRRGYRVATIKHDAHCFEIDHPGKDSYRHFTPEPRGPFSPRRTKSPVCGGWRGNARSTKSRRKSAASI
jgi:GTPase SAR1 family protein